MRPSVAGVSVLREGGEASVEGNIIFCEAKKIHGEKNIVDPKKMIYYIQSKKWNGGK